MSNTYTYTPPGKEPVVVVANTKAEADQLAAAKMGHADYIGALDEAGSMNVKVVPNTAMGRLCKKLFG